MARRLFASSLVLVCLFAALGWSPAASTQKPASKVTFRLDWKPGAQQAPFFYARDQGYYAQEGIELQIIPGSGSSDSAKQLGSKAVDLALVDSLVLVQAAEQRVPVKSVAAYFQRTPIVLISLQTKPVTDLKQLLGDVKVGVKKGSATFQGLAAMLSANNIQMERLKMVDVGFGIQPLLVKQVDAMMDFTMDGPVAAESAGMPVHELFIADHGVNSYGLTIASHDEFIRAKAALISAFLRATRKAVQEAAGAKPAVIRALAKSADGIDVARELRGFDRTLPFLTAKGVEFGAQSEARWQQTIDTAKRLGLVEKAPAAKDVFVAGLLK
jgi:NitT/TauT family transport system substrate-binding protein